MLYTIINVIILSDLIGICMLVPMYLQKYEEKELGESLERLENTLDSFSPSQYTKQKIVNELTKWYEGE